jgi:hypothetical protein
MEAYRSVEVKLRAFLTTKLNGSFTLRSLHSSRKNPQNPLERMKDGLQSPSGLDGEEMNPVSFTVKLQMSSPKTLTLLRHIPVQQHTNTLPLRKFV